MWQGALAVHRKILVIGGRSEDGNNRTIQLIDLEKEGYSGEEDMLFYSIQTVSTDVYLLLISFSRMPLETFAHYELARLCRPDKQLHNIVFCKGKSQLFYTQFGLFFSTKGEDGFCIFYRGSNWLRTRRRMRRYPRFHIKKRATFLQSTTDK